MQRGTCFINYEDFKECFTAYKKETQSSFSITTSVSVRHHNSKFSTDIRPDIIFTEVKFCCSKLYGPNGKRRPQDGVCPAYFLIQYDVDLDRLVVKEECSTHVHSKKTNPPQASLVPPPEMGEHLSSDSEVPSKKICHTRLSLSPEKQSDQEEDVEPDNPSPCKPQSHVPLDIGEGHSKPTPTPESVSTGDVLLLDGLIKEFQKSHSGSKAALTIGDQRQFEQLCFQTSSMSSWFLKFPESLLLHRVSSKLGYVLYAFLVETKERMGKIVHFSFVKEDNAKNISKMLEMLKYFNSDWQKIKVVYVDVAFGQTDILKGAFPLAQVLLSIYHTAHLIERKIKGSANFKLWVHKWIDEAIYHTTPEKLSFLAEKLEHRLDQDLYDKLCKDFINNELLWYMHVKKGEHSCSTYMDSVGLIDETISSCIAKQTSMESAIHEFLQYADCFNSKGLDKRSISFPAFSHKAHSKNSAKKLRSILPALSNPPLASKVSSKPAKKSPRQPKKVAGNGLIISPKSGGWRPVQLANKILLSLKEICNDIGFQLCSKEWEVVKRSTQLINELPDFTTVQILEEAHNVSFNGRSCTCYFNTDYNLPCRHIMSMLYAYKRPVEEHMVSLRWRKDYVKPLSDFKVYTTVTAFSNCTQTKENTTARIGKINNLAKEFYNLLMQSDGQEMQVRISTLQMIVDMWRSDSSPTKPFPAQDQGAELPYRWVKKEPVEGEAMSHELCRLDPKLPYS
ncbi:zinc finger SWIM domain-containing protein 3 [Dendropsophus ebraccatus]|uniref:zinc finger SWIM domain-containing protein 3 n=1 Tax=Dendropsophus ebraccatus TaxID=150705 RepID=UPI0038318EC9